MTQQEFAKKVFELCDSKYNVRVTFMAGVSDLDYGHSDEVNRTYTCQVITPCGVLHAQASSTKDYNQLAENVLLDMKGQIEKEIEEAKAFIRKYNAYEHLVNMSGCQDVTLNDFPF